MLLFNEPFTPGDLVTFRCGYSEFMGRVERVGWVSLVTHFECNYSR